MGIGLDLCEIERLGRAVERPRFMERVFTPRERERIRAASGARKAEIAAGTFAAKEAVAKALGTGFSDFFTDAVEILPNADGRPECALTGGAKDRADRLCGADRWRVWVSITHDGGMAAANAILEGFGDPPSPPAPPESR